MKTSYDQIDQLTVLKETHRFSDCDQSNRRFFCLNDCFRKRARLARYFYHSNETGIIHLNYDERNKTIRENEKICFEECKRENCKMNQLIANNELKEDYKVETFEGRPKLSEFDFWLQFIGLVGSFAGFSVHDLNSIAIEFILQKVKQRRRKVRIGLFYLKWSILFFSLASFGYLGTRTVLDQKLEETEKGITRFSIQPKIFRLAICVFLEKYRKSSSFEYQTMSEIERATNRTLDDELEAIYFNYQGRSSYRVDYQVQPKILFKRIFKRYYRCFLLSIHPIYQVITLSPKLTIKFKKRGLHSRLYLLSENEDLNDKSFEYSGLFAFFKRIVKRLKASGRCVDYEEKYAGNCRGKWNCVERCIQRKYMERYNKTTFGIMSYAPVIDRDWFSLTEWNTSCPIGNVVNHNKYQNISRECLKEILDEKICVEIKIEPTVQIRQSTVQIIKIDLQFDVEQSIEEESLSWYKLLLNILSIQSILFGLTVFQLLSTFSNFIQTRLKVRENKMVLFFIYLLCSIGGIWHAYHILHLVISGELVSTRYYELAKQVEMPEMVFCIKIDKKIDRNQKLTGTYLEEQTQEMTAKATFSSITYLDKSNEWSDFDLNQMERFFLLNMKCFRFKINLRYKKDQFHFSTDNRVLMVNFDKKLERDKQVYFMTKPKEMEEFSKMVKLFSTSSIIQETSLYEYEDRFSFIRKHFLSPQERNSNGLNKLQSNDHNLKTMNIPVKEKDFKFELDEDLFEQLYCSFTQKDQNKRTNLNYQQLVVSNHLRKKDSGSHLSFSLVFLQKIVLSTNEENFGMLILSLLNVLSIWFDLGVLDLHQYFPIFHDHLLVHLYLHLPVFFFVKINKALIFASNWLKKFELPLYEKLKPRKKRF